MIDKEESKKDGDYAVLSIKPRLPSSLKLDDLSTEEKSQVQSEEEIT